MWLTSWRMKHSPISRVVYDLVIAARDPKPSLETLVASLVPIYFGRVASFVIENRNVTTDQAEERVERQAREFELLKPYLTKRWAEATVALEAPAEAVDAGAPVEGRT